MVDKPYIGVAFGLVDPNHIQAACQLMTLTALLGALAAWTMPPVLTLLAAVLA
jgi:hypothetical protein